MADSRFKKAEEKRTAYIRQNETLRRQIKGT